MANEAKLLNRLPDSALVPGEKVITTYGIRGTVEGTPRHGNLPWVTIKWEVPIEKAVKEKHGLPTKRAM